MDGALAAEARALLASARAWLDELVEEGVDGFVRVAPAAPAPAPDAGVPGPVLRTQREPEPTRPTLAQVREQLDLP